MDPFLKQTARHYFNTGKLEKYCFIFPNRRSASFFRKYVGEEVACRGTVPQTAPAITTINDFFYRISGKKPTDRISLLLALYDEYKALAPHPEALDDFIFWGDVLLSDFDDVDKYLVAAGNLFTNVSEFKEMQDDFSYLSAEQKEAVERFIMHFGPQDGEVKRKFLGIWSILLPLYRNFRSSLERKGLSYEGQVYRDFAERLESETVVDILSDRFAEAGIFVFAGLNALNECEKKVMRKMRDAGVAEFVWDYSSPLIKNPMNRSSFFMETNVRDFPPAFSLDDDGLKIPEINVLSVPSGIGQVKQLPEIFRLTGAKGIETAVVLPEESLLIPAMNSIPESFRDFNVTMGYPLNGSELWSLIKEISSLQAHSRIRDGKILFYHKQVWTIFSNAVVKSATGESGREKMNTIRKGSGYYVEEEEFVGDEVLSSIFMRISSTEEIPSYLKNLLATLAGKLRKVEDMELELDFARVLYESVEKLSCHKIEVQPATYFKLLEKMMSGTSVPFEGEPLKGLQIMGPLETRALDFSNLIILSCNEGVFPKKSISSSFIPPQLRKGFGLPTYEHQDTVWAYYFYRMIQRAEKLWMLYDSRAEGMRGGEPSRYISQLEMHFKLTVKRHVVIAPIYRSKEELEIIKKAEDLDRLHEGHLSATAIQNYLTCPAKFYYQSVCLLKERDEVSESLDAGMQGSVFHETMEELYRGRNFITKDELISMSKGRDAILEAVGRHIMEKLHCFEVSGRNIIYRNLVGRYVLQVLQRDLELLERYDTDKFRILGLERWEEMQLGGFSFVGAIDRLDSFDPDEIRIVDYKTGSVTDKDIHINEGNAAQVVSDLFDGNGKERPKIALQLYLYGLLIGRRKEFSGKRLVNSIYQTSRLFVEEVENVALCPSFCRLMSERLDELIKEISDTSIPWKRTGNRKDCEWCDFKMICGR